MIGRKLVAQDPDCAGDGIFRARVRKVVGMGDAFISYKYPGESVKRDRVEIKSGEVDIPVLYKPFEIERQDFLAFVNEGINLETTSSNEAGKVVTKLENELILQGWKPNGTDYKVKGLYQSASNTISTSLDFGTAGNADKAVNAAIAALETDSVEATAYHLIINPTQMAELRPSRNGTSGIKELPEVIESLNNGSPKGPGQVWSTSLMAAGTGMVIPYDPSMEFFRLLNPLEISSELGTDSKAPNTSPIYGNIYETLLIDIINTDAICTLTGI